MARRSRGKSRPWAIASGGSIATGGTCNAACVSAMTPQGGMNQGGSAIVRFQVHGDLIPDTNGNSVDGNHLRPGASRTRTNRRRHPGRPIRELVHRCHVITYPARPGEFYAAGRNDAAWSISPACLEQDRPNPSTQATGLLPPGPACQPCPDCGGLECLCRPRFFAGQLLTEQDLNRLDNYILAKNRLHNRYLVGHGVVCGLEVSCSPCANTITSRPATRSTHAATTSSSVRLTRSISAS